MRPLRYPLTVFYDASCQICSGEMHALKARDRLGRLELIDCSATDFDETVLAGTPLQREDLMECIHARDAHGSWLVGPDVLAAAYGTAGLRAAAGFWGSRGLRPLVARLYAWIADHRRLLSGGVRHALSR